MPACISGRACGSALRQWMVPWPLGLPMQHIMVNVGRMMRGCRGRNEPGWTCMSFGKGLFFEV
jgi:hypothetical protein